MDAIRILIADDHAIVREGLRTLITSEPGMELVGEAADGVDAVSKARALQPDVILMDLMMPRKNGLEAIADIKHDNPQARILVLTSFAGDDQVLPAIKAGALGYLIKGASPQQLLQAIYDIHGGRSSASSGSSFVQYRERR
jgi:NarL family two-component system response regulator LiaR